MPDNYLDFMNLNTNGTIPINDIDYNALLKIDPQIKNSQGANTTVGILDHYINMDLPFANPIEHSNNAPTNTPPSIHGSGMAGLIAGNNKIFGVAKQTRIIELPIYNLDGSRMPNMINDAFEYLSHLPLQGRIIINISQEIPFNFLDKIESLLDNENIILVASAGTDDQLANDTLQFPSSIPNVISVGSISNSYYNPDNRGNFNNYLDFVLPNFNYLTYSLQVGSFKYLGKDSAACAIVSGIISLIVSNNPNISRLEVKNTLQQLSLPYSSGSQILNNINLIKP